MLRALFFLCVYRCGEESPHHNHIFIAIKAKGKTNVSIGRFDKEGRAKYAEVIFGCSLFVYLLGSNAPCCLRTSATIGTVELTGLEMTRIKAVGQFLAIPSDKSRIMPALIYTKKEEEQEVSNKEQGAWFRSLFFFIIQKRKRKRKICNKNLSLFLFPRPRLFPFPHSFLLSCLFPFDSTVLAPTTPTHNAYSDKELTREVQNLLSLLFDDDFFISFIPFPHPVTLFLSPLSIAPSFVNYNFTHSHLETHTHIDA